MSDKPPPGGRGCGEHRTPLPHLLCVQRNSVQRNSVCVTRGKWSAEGGLHKLFFFLVNGESPLKRGFVLGAHGTTDLANHSHVVNVCYEEASAAGDNLSSHPALVCVYCTFYFDALMCFALQDLQGTAAPWAAAHSFTCGLAPILVILTCRLLPLSCVPGDTG
jgi:hypothetical protein